MRPLATPPELVERTEEFVRALLGRLLSGRSPRAQVYLLEAGIAATRELLELRDAGLEVSEETIAYALEQLADAVGRLLELLPEDEL